MRKSRSAFLAVGLFSGAVNVLALTGSLYMLQVYDRVIPSRSVPTLIGFTVLLLLLYAAFGVLDAVRMKILSRIGTAMERRLRHQVFDAMLLLPLRSRPEGDALQPVRDLDVIRNFLSSLAPTALLDMPWLPLYLGLIYLLHPVLAGFAAVGALTLVALTALTEARTQKPSLAVAKSISKRNAHGAAAQINAEVIRAMGLSPALTRRWDALNERLISEQAEASNSSAGLGTVSKVLRLILQSGMLGLGAYLAIKGEVSAGVIIAGSIVLSRALAPIETAIAHWKGFVAFRQSSARLDRLLSQIPPSSGAMELPAPERTINVTNLTVAAPGETTPILTGVSFNLEAGDGLAIIGPSASGKSTLARALVGAWQPLPRGGNVRLDGATIDQWPPERLGRHIGYLPQDVELFDGTVAENIARLDPEAASESIIAAARLAGVHELILHLSDGYKTRVGSAGARLSGGQRQRLGLARALYGNPFLVVLDEPNAHLDADGEAALTEAIRSLRQRGAIVVVIAHRPNVLTHLNKVLTLANGKVQAFGDREEILRKVLQPAPVAQKRDVSPKRNLADDLTTSGAFGGRT